MIVVNSHIRKLSYLIMAVSTLMALMLFGCDKDNGSDGTEIFLNKNELYLEVGKSERLVASFDPFDASNLAHKWSSSDNNVAIVDETGKVTAVKTGTAVIMARALSSGNSAKCNVTVVDRIVLPNQIELNETNVNIAVGDTFALVVTIKPDNATDKTYSLRSLDESIASINDDGIITANSIGNTTIEIMTGSGDLKAICEVSVKERGVVFEEPYVSNITDVSAEITGVVRVYGVSLEELGICYSSDEDFDIYDNKVASVKSDIISCKIDSLTPEATYYVCSYAVDENGNVTYSNKVSFTTKGVLKTDFQALEVYEDKLVLVSDAPLGYEKVDVCYGIEPNPTVTDNIAVAYINSSNGKLVLNVTGLSYNTTYYLRSYYIIDNKFVYSDDEVEVSTIGENNIWASTMTYSFCRIGSDYSNQFSFEAKINLETVLEGEFYWKAKDGNYLSKSSILTSSNKVKELYFEGNNQFIYQIIYTTPLYTYPTVTFNKIPREIIHMPTGVKYYVNVPSNNKTYKTGDVPYVGYDK